MVQFTQIPDTLLVPGMFSEFDASNADSGPTLQPFDVLLVGQHNLGSAPAVAPVQVFTTDDVEALAGRGSQLAMMAAAWFANNTITSVHVLPISDDGGAAAATSDIVVTGPATATGTLRFIIAGTQVNVAVTSGDTATVIGDSIEAAVTANPDLPVTASNLAGTVTLTAKNAGESGNDFRVFLNYFTGQATPAGVAVTLNDFAGGTTNPTLAQVWAAIPNSQFHVIVAPYTDTTSMASIETEADSRWDALRAIEFAYVACRQDSAANLITYGDARNNEHVVVFGVEDSPTPPLQLAAMAAAQIARSAEQDPALPFTSLELAGALPPLPANQFSFANRQNMLLDGMATFRYGAGGEVQIERARTNYQVSAGGSPSSAYRDINVHFILSYLRYDWNARLTNGFARFKIGDPEVVYPAGSRIITTKSARAFGVNVLARWALQGLIEDLAAAKASFTVVRNAAEGGRLDFLFGPNLVNGFRIGATQIAFRP